MDNQHRKIKGYKELSQEEIDAMNEIKEMAEKVGDLVASLTIGANDSDRNPFVGPDPRWVAIGRTHLQEGFMALTRSIAKPGFF